MKITQCETKKSYSLPCVNYMHLMSKGRGKFVPISIVSLHQCVVKIEEEVVRGWKRERGVSFHRLRKTNIHSETSLHAHAHANKFHIKLHDFSHSISTPNIKWCNFYSNLMRNSKNKSIEHSQRHSS